MFLCLHIEAFNQIVKWFGRKTFVIQASIHVHDKAMQTAEEPSDLIPFHILHEQKLEEVI